MVPLTPGVHLIRYIKVYVLLGRHCNASHCINSNNSNARGCLIQTPALIKHEGLPKYLVRAGLRLRQIQLT